MVLTIQHLEKKSDVVTRVKLAKIMYGNACKFNCSSCCFNCPYYVSCLATRILENTMLTAKCKVDTSSSAYGHPCFHIRNWIYYME